MAKLKRLSNYISRMKPRHRPGKISASTVSLKPLLPSSSSKTSRQQIIQRKTLSSRKLPKRPLQMLLFKSHLVNKASR
jgi:hypothetical protein